jgi:hypothetical protein
VAWTESEYHFDNIPNTLIRSLRHHSLTYDKQSQSGQFKHSGPRSITWHGDGSYFLRLAQSSSSYDDWHLPTEAINNAWKRLLGIHDNRGRPQFRMSYSLAVCPTPSISGTLTNPPSTRLSIHMHPIVTYLSRRLSSTTKCLNTFFGSLHASRSKV